MSNRFWNGIGAKEVVVIITTIGTGGGVGVAITKLGWPCLAVIWAVFVLIGLAIYIWRLRVEKTENEAAAHKSRMKDIQKRGIRNRRPPLE